MITPQTMHKNDIITLSTEITEEFLALQDIRPSSRITYKHVLHRFFQWTTTHSVENLNRLTILRYKTWLDEQAISVFTKSLYLVVVRRFFAWTEEQNIYPNITQGIKNPKKQTKSHYKDSLRIDDIKLLFKTINTQTLQGKRDFALLNTLIRTGLRLREICNARIQDVEYMHEQARLWIQGKGRHGKDEFVVLTQSVLEPIQQYLSERVEAKPTEPLFASISDRNFGKFLTTFSLSRIVRTYLTKAGIKTKRITAHSLRHTFGVLSMQAGASLYEVQLAMRHAAPSTTQMYLGDLERIKRLEASPEHKIGTFLETHGI